VNSQHQRKEHKKPQQLKTENVKIV